MANEEHDFYPFISALQKELDMLKSGSVFLIVDNVSKDKTLELCRHLSENDKRFHTIWAPENRNVVDAYIRGYKEALKIPMLNLLLKWMQVYHMIRLH